jgi:L-asparaginase
MASTPGIVVVLGTGGTIAGTAASATQHTGYQAGVLGAEALIAAVPALQGLALEAHTLAQLDSCDMDHATWALLAASAAEHLARPEVAGVVVTHGTDTLEETAYFLHRTVAAGKPLVLTAAMRPATALSPDGPQNLFDAVTLAREPAARGVLVVMGGVVYAGADLRKLHGYRVAAFSAGDAGAVALMEDGRVRGLRPWPAAALHGAATRLGAPENWPQVDVVMSHAQADGRVVDALVAAGGPLKTRGIVIAGTGNGSVHRSLKAAAQRAVARGVRVVRASRCWAGGVVGEEPAALPSYGVLTPVQARIELMLDLLADRPS